MCERHAAAQVPSKGKVQQLKNKFKTDRGVSFTIYKYLYRANHLILNRDSLK